MNSDKRGIERMSPIKLHYGVRLRPDQLKYLKTLPHSSEWVREAIDEKIKRDKLSHKEG